MLFPSLLSFLISGFYLFHNRLFSPDAAIQRILLLLLLFSTLGSKDPEG